MKNTTMTTMTTETVYIPRAVAYINATHEGGGGILDTQERAIELGATNIRIGDQGHFVANWPQHYWDTPEGPTCPCGAHTCAGRPSGGYSPSVLR